MKELYIKDINDLLDQMPELKNIDLILYSMSQRALESNKTEKLKYVAKKLKQIKDDVHGYDFELEYRQRKW